MNILVFNGSPKSDKSVTIAYISHLQRAFPNHTFNIINISQIIPKLEQDEALFNSIIAKIEQADGILWAFPVYILLVHSGYKRFIELISEKNITSLFCGKYTAVLSTSIHICDHTAHNYIRAICDDLNMVFCGAYSAGMMDLRQDKERKRLRTFIANFLDDITTKSFYPKMFTPLQTNSTDYMPGPTQSQVNTLGKKIVILTDALRSQKNLLTMINRFKECFAHQPEIINLWDVNISTGCLGCLRCGFDHRCIHRYEDDYEDFYNNKLRQADVIVFAGTIIDRFLSSRWKLFFDRGFFNNHVPSLSKKQFGFIVSGPLKQLPNLTQFFDLYAQWQESNCVGFINDEKNNSSAIDSACDSLARGLIRASQQKYFAPKTFLGIAFHKILRDALYSAIRFPVIQSHRYFLKNQLYDFPHKNYCSRIASTIWTILYSLPFINRFFKKKIFERMLNPIEKYSNQL